jgi:hypothetical protein
MEISRRIGLASESGVYIKDSIIEKRVLCRPINCFNVIDKEIEITVFYKTYK